jgi:hypothetical protein
MTGAAERALRRHLREKTTIDRLAKGVRKPSETPEPETRQSPTTSTGLPVEEQIRKKWGPDKGGLPTFLREPPPLRLRSRRRARGA